MIADTAERPMSEEQRLWIAAICNAALEAMGLIKEGHRKARPAIQREAIEWFRQNGKDFQEVCLMAGLDPAYVRAGVLAIIAEGRRNPPRSDGRARSQRHRHQHVPDSSDRAWQSPESVASGEAGGRRQNGRAYDRPPLAPSEARP